MGTGVQIRRRRGTAEQHETFTGAEGEITVDSTRNETRVHDGVTPGGRPSSDVMRADTVEGLRALTVAEIRGRPVNLLGYSTPGDGGGGTLYWDASSTEDDNGGTIFKPDSIDAGDPGRWKRVGDRFSLEQWGVSTSNTEVENAERFKSAIYGSKNLYTRMGPYIFDFEQSAAPTNSLVFTLDMGTQKHTLKNFAGIIANSTEHARINIRCSASDTPMARLFESASASSLHCDFIEVTDVFNQVSTEFNGFSLIRVEHEIEKEFDFSCEVALFNKIITEDDGSIVPSEIFANPDAQNPLSTPLKWSFGSLTIKECYSVDLSGNIIDGTTSAFRLFKNPNIVNINNLVAENYSERLFKNRSGAQVSIGNCYLRLDDRFKQGDNHNGTFIAQAGFGSGNIPCSFTIQYLDADFSAANAGPNPTPSLFSVDSLSHKAHIYAGQYKNIGIAALGGSNADFSFSNLSGVNFRMQAPDTEKVVISNFDDSDLISINTKTLFLDNFRISSTALGVLRHAYLKNGTFYDWDIAQKIADIVSIDNVRVEFTTNSGTDDRPFYLATIDSDMNITASGVRIIDNTASLRQVFRSEIVGSGRVTFRDIFSNEGSLAFIGTGTWTVAIDNCDPGTVSGGGVVSQKTATYS